MCVRSLRAGRIVRWTAKQPAGSTRRRLGGPSRLVRRAIWPALDTPVAEPRAGKLPATETAMGGTSSPAAFPFTSPFLPLPHSHFGFAEIPLLNLHDERLFGPHEAQLSEVFCTALASPW